MKYDVSVFLQTNNLGRADATNCIYAQLKYKANQLHYYNIQTQHYHQLKPWQILLTLLIHNYFETFQKRIM